MLKKRDITSFVKAKLSNQDGYSVYGNTHMYNNYYTDEVSKLIVKSSFMILKSNKINSTFLSILNRLPNIFIIDFENRDYFWLSNFSNLRLVYE